MAITSRCGRDNPGSIPGWDIFLASLAQLVEHTPLKRRVVGSRPTGGFFCLKTENKNTADSSVGRAPDCSGFKIRRVPGSNPGRRTYGLIAQW